MSKIIPSQEQQAIIDFPIDQNLRVEAGAGTGKTTTVALRLVELIRSNGWDPTEVLGITFTNKAAQELAERIRQLLEEKPDHAVGLRQTEGEVFDQPSDPHHLPEVNTYHGFAFGLLKEFGSLVGFGGQTLITPINELQLIDRILRQKEYDRLDTTYFGLREDIRKLADSLSNHGLHPDQVTAPSVSDPDDPWFKRSQMLEVCRQYQQQKKERDWVSYSDLLLLANQLVEEHPWVSEAIAERYRAVILDEYQDTNPTQRILLQTIFCPEGNTRVPLTAIGDQNQTIYQWRGASLQNFAKFNMHFPARSGSPSANLSLTLNRRSGQNILNLANRMRANADRNPDGLELKALEDAPPGQVTLSWETDAIAEARWIARQVKRLKDLGISYQSMAVLFRKNKDMDLVAKILEEHEIPIEITSLGGLLKVPEVAELQAWMNLLANPEDNASLTRILTGSKFRLGLGDLGPLAYWAKRRKWELTSTQPKDGGNEDIIVPLLEAVYHLERVEGLSIAAQARLDRFVELHRRLVVSAQGEPVGQVARLILDQLGVWRDLGTLPDLQRDMATLNLHRFLDLADEWEPFDDHPTLSLFMHYLEELKEDKTEEPEAVRLSGTEAVTLITVHRAKGLEWEVVFIPALYQNRGRGNFPSTGLAYDNPIKRAVSLPYELRLDQDSLPPLEEYPLIADDKDRKSVDEINRKRLKQHQLEQEMRLAYVAVTRAKQHLFLSGAWWYGTPETHKQACRPTMIWDIGSMTGNAIIEQSPEESPERPEKIHLEPAGADREPQLADWIQELRVEAEEPGYLEQKATSVGLGREFDQARQDLGVLFDLPEPHPLADVQRLMISVTGLSTYSLCPRRYFWSEVDPLPRRFSPWTRRGTDIHRQIELHNRGVVSLEEQQENYYDSSADEDISETTSESKKHPPPYEVFRSSKYAQSQPILVEERFELPVAEQTWVRGRIDAVYETEPGRWEIVDFKTGGKPPTPNMVQLQAYGWAAQEVRFTAPKPRTSEVSYVYLGRGLETETAQVDQPWLDQAKTELVNLVTGIRSEQFEPQPNPGCHQCDFLQFCEPGQLSVSTPQPN